MAPPPSNPPGLRGRQASRACGAAAVAAEPAPAVVGAVGAAAVGTAVGGMWCGEGGGSSYYSWPRRTDTLPDVASR